MLTYGNSTARLYGAFIDAVAFAGMAPTGIVGIDAGEKGTGEEGKCHDAKGYHGTIFQQFTIFEGCPVHVHAGSTVISGAVHSSISMVTSESETDVTVAVLPSGRERSVPI